MSEAMEKLDEELEKIIATLLGTDNSDYMKKERCQAIAQTKQAFRESVGDFHGEWYNNQTKLLWEEASPARQLVRYVQSQLTSAEERKEK